MAFCIPVQAWSTSHAKEHPTKRDTSPRMAFQKRGSVGSNNDLEGSPDQSDGSIVDLAQQVRSELEILVVKVLKHQNRAISVDGDAAVKLGFEIQLNHSGHEVP